MQEADMYDPDTRELINADVSIAAIIGRYRAQSDLYVRALAGIAHDALLTRPGPRSNPMLWIAGHLTQMRTHLLGAFGPPRPAPWADLFGTGSIIGDLSRYPGVGELDAVWSSASHELLRRLGALDANQLAAPPPPAYLSDDGSLRGTVSYYAFHEAYHIGQMGYLRKLLGASPLLDG
jgi:hypothetical protein